MPSRSRPPAQDDDKLVRRDPGTYQTSDDRFVVRQSGGRWFLVDTVQTDELGQELVRGPFATRKAAADGISAARLEQPKRLPIAPAAKARRSSSETGPRPAPSKPPPPPSWIDRLPKSDAAAVRSAIRALEREGVSDAEEVVRRDRLADAPEIAARLITRGVTDIVDRVPTRERRTARTVAGRVVAFLTREGMRQRAPLPGWSLVEVDGGAAGRAPRRITIELDTGDGEST